MAGRITQITPKSKTGDTITHVLEGSQRVTISSNGVTAMQSYQVHNILGGKDEILFNATQAPNVPRYLSFHPKIPGIWVTNVESELMAGKVNSALVTITWGFVSGSDTTGDFDNEPGDDALPTVEVSTTLQSMSTNLDVDRNPIIVQYIAPGEEEIKTQNGEVELQVPMTTVIYRRRELNSPGDKSKAYTGTLNSIPVFGGDPARVWLCSAIHGTSDDGGTTYNVTYEFIRAPQRYDNYIETWDATIIYIDPNTNKPPPDVNVQTGNGIMTGVRLLKETDFNELNLGIF